MESIVLVLLTAILIFAMTAGILVLYMKRLNDLEQNLDDITKRFNQTSFNERLNELNTRVMYLERDPDEHPEFVPLRGTSSIIVEENTEE